MGFLFVSFVAGVLTVLAPCILPLLPVVVGASAGARSKWTPYIVVGSLAASVIAFTFLLKVSSAFITIPPETWSYISGGILVAFGLTLVFPSLCESLPGVSRLSASSNRLLGAGFTRKSIWGDVLIGAALGPVFSTCSPTYFVILASVLPASFLLGTAYLVAYVVGLSIILLLIALLGERFVSRLGVVADPRSYYKRAIGAVFMLVGIAVIAGFDKQFQTKLLDAGVFDVTKFEQRLLEQVDDPVQPSSQLKPTRSNVSADAYTKTPYVEIVNPSGFVNTDGITLKELVGKKVILVDFMTYSCINCQRTYPYLASWYAAYKDQGLEIVAIHTPEFAFEKDKVNVENAMKKFGLTFPVVLDNNYATWNAWGNRYWPRKYLIDINGNIVYDHIGEGNYRETESKIVELLIERKRALGEKGAVEVNDEVAIPQEQVDFSKVKTPETYLGASRVQYLVNAPQASCIGGSCTYAFSDMSTFKGYELSGAWRIDSEYANLESAAGALRMGFSANKVNLVAGSDKPVRVRVLVDGVFQREVTIRAYDLYNLVDLKGVYGSHILELQFLDPGIQAFAFTFG